MPIYYITGEEEYLREEALAKIKRDSLGKKFDPADYQVYHGRQIALREVIDFLKTAPFLSPVRLAVIRSADKIPAADREVLKEYVGNPSSTGVLVLVLDTPDNFFDQLLSKLANKIECRRLYGRRLKMWVRDRLKGYQVSPEVIDLLIDTSGGILNRIAASVDKLRLYLGSRRRVTASDIEKLSQRSSRQGVFDLIRAVASRDCRRALPILNQLLRDGTKGGEIIGLIAWQMRQLRRGGELLNEKRDRPGISKELNIKPFFLDSFLSQVRFFKEAKIRKAHQLLLKADQNIKQSRINERFILEELVIRLCLL